MVGIRPLVIMLDSPQCGRQHVCAEIQIPYVRLFFKFRFSLAQGKDIREQFGSNPHRRSGLPDPFFCLAAGHKKDLQTSSLGGLQNVY